jgi:hypothetical protein
MFAFSRLYLLVGLSAGLSDAVETSSPELGIDVSIVPDSFGRFTAKLKEHLAGRFFPELLS